MDYVDLDEVGRGQARHLRVYAGAHGIHPTHYVVSPAARTRSTHSLSAPGIVATLDERLVELTWGEWEGELRSIANRPEVVRARRLQGFGFRPPGGESYADVRHRALEAIRAHAGRAPHGSHIWIHTHRNVIKAIVYRWMGWTPESILEVGPDVVSLTRLVYEGGQLSLVFYNRSTLAQR